jgi:hypothetical protein
MPDGTLILAFTVRPLVNADIDALILLLSTPIVRAEDTRRCFLAKLDEFN